MKRLPQNVISLTGADVAGRLLSFLAVAYLARTLGPASMGTLAVGMAILTYGSIFADAGLPILGTRSVAVGDRNLKSLVKQIWSSRLFLSILTLGVGALVLFMAVKDITTRNVAVVYLLSLIPSAAFLDWLFQGLKAMTTVAMGRIVGMTTYLLFILLFVSQASGIVFVPLGWFVGTTAQGLYLWIMFRRSQQGVSEETSPSGGVFGTIRQGVPLGVATLISQVVIQFPFIYLGFFSTPESTGLYSIAFRVIVLLLVIDRVFYTIFFPAISQSFKEGTDPFKQRFDRTLKFVSAGALYIGTLSVLAGRSIFPWIFGSEFNDSSLIFQLLVAYFVLSAINSTFTFALIGAEKETAYTRSLVVGAVAFFAIMLLPISVSTTLMAPLALALFQATSLLVMTRELQKMIPIAMFRRVFVPLVLASVVTSIFTSWQNHNPVLSLIAAIIIVLPVLGLAAGIKKEDLQYLKSAIL